MNAQILEDKEGHLFLVGEGKAFDVSWSEPGRALRDLLAYSQGRMGLDFFWTVPIVDTVPDRIGTIVVAEIYDVVKGTRNDESCIALYPWRMGPAARVYIFGSLVPVPKRGDGQV